MWYDAEPPPKIADHFVVIRMKRAHSRRAARIVQGVAAAGIALSAGLCGCKDTDPAAPAPELKSASQPPAERAESERPQEREPAQSSPPVNTIPTPVVNAIYRNDLTGVERFLDQGVSINQQDANGYSLLHHACRAGHLEIAELLIERGADVNIRARVNITPLISAVRANELEMCRLLVENGADLNVRGGSDNHLTALGLAVRANHVAIVDYLRSVGAEM